MSRRSFCMARRRTLMRLGLAVVSAVTVAGLWPATALRAAAPTRRHTVRFSEAEQSVAVRTDATFPAVGSTQLGTAVIRTKAFGPGEKAQIFHLKITGQPTATTFAVRLSGTDFFAAGTQRWTARGTGVLKRDGTLAATGKGTYRGGTGRFRRITGSFTFTSTQPPMNPVTTTRSKGKVSY
jgi:hypothetical protein